MVPASIAAATSSPVSGPNLNPFPEIGREHQHPTVAAEHETLLGRGQEEVGHRRHRFESLHVAETPAIGRDNPTDVRGASVALYERVGRPGLQAEAELQGHIPDRWQAPEHFLAAEVDPGRTDGPGRRPGRARAKVDNGATMRHQVARQIWDQPWQTDAGGKDGHVAAEIPLRPARHPGRWVHRGHRHLGVYRNPGRPQPSHQILEDSV